VIFFLGLLACPDAAHTDTGGSPAAGGDCEPVVYVEGLDQWLAEGNDCIHVQQYIDEGATVRGVSASERFALLTLADDIAAPRGQEPLSGSLSLSIGEAYGTQTWKFEVGSCSAPQGHLAALYPVSVAIPELGLEADVNVTGNVYVWEDTTFGRTYIDVPTDGIEADWVTGPYLSVEIQVDADGAAEVVGWMDEEVIFASEGAEYEVY